MSSPPPPPSSQKPTPTKKPAHKNPHKSNPLARKYGHHLTPQTQQSSSTPLSTLRKQLRDAKRVLSRPGKSATAEQAIQRKIQALNVEIRERERETKEEGLRVKYKYIRFVEQKKCMRRIKQLSTLLSATDPSDESYTQIKSDLTTAQTQLSYTRHFPADMKYIALFPAETEEKVTGTETARERILEYLKGREVKGVIRMKDVFGEKEKGVVEEEEGEKEGDEFFIME
ncbi:hypothetical protein DFS34DRAFT_690731 [Phlyctochytrium arcticum]|nr:hypothetical protein DFS34DRAFT_690731 [Phlyctochytrium arcticum]